MGYKNGHLWGRLKSAWNGRPSVTEAASKQLLPSGAPLGPHPDQHFGCVTYAQHGDDLIVVAAFGSMGIDRPTYLDIGAHHPFNISNTALLYARGSRGVNIEANPNLIEAFIRHRPDDINLNVGVSAKACGPLAFYMIDRWSGRNTFDKAVADEFVKNYPEFSISETINVPVMTVSQVVDNYCGGQFPDFLSIDVEGLDEAIIRSINFAKSAPKIICVEAVAIDGVRTDSALKSFLLDQGYFSLIRCGGNTIFVQERYRAQVV